MKRLIFFILISLSGIPVLHAQNITVYKWWDPALNSFPVIEGQGWPKQLLHSYNRLPEKAEDHVRPVVWDKSLQSSGLVIRFRTNASEIQVRYKVKDEISFLHMPATGVSGVDLYALDKNGKWEWDGAESYTFGDTIIYIFNAIRPSYNRIYYLYLPLYNKINWFEIGVSEEAKLTPLPVRNQKPIVVYGTSIAQGGVASRPGMAWPAILGRKLNTPVINLGFSSNGLLEKSVLDLISEIDAKIYILDCFPNMYNLPKEEVRSRIIQAIKLLNEKRPNAPILLTEHADANIGMMDTILNKAFNRINRISQDVFNEMKTDGVKNIYYLPSNQIGLNIESTVDGQHPNDLGMTLYADAYVKCLEDIFQIPDIKQDNVSSSLNATSLTHSQWKGFKRTDFELQGRHCIVVSPKKPLPNMPWIWRTEFFGAFAQADSMLAARGYHVVYIDIVDMYGASVSQKYMDIFYAYLTKKEGLSSKSVLEGFSRGGLSALNWAIRHPDKVSSIYLDAPVCDLRSWPGGRGMYSYSHNDWIKLKQAYGFTNNEEAFNYKNSPLDNLEPLAKYKIPIISVCGAKDTLVPMSLNSGLLKYKYEKLGGKMKVIVKQDIYHHPHSLEDPRPIIEFIMKSRVDS